MELEKLRERYLVIDLQLSVNAIFSRKILAFFCLDRRVQVEDNWGVFSWIYRQAWGQREPFRMLDVALKHGRGRREVAKTSLHLSIEKSHEHCDTEWKMDSVRRRVNGVVWCPIWPVSARFVPFAFDVFCGWLRCRRWPTYQLNRLVGMLPLCRSYLRFLSSHYNWTFRRGWRRGWRNSVPHQTGSALNSK